MSSGICTEMPIAAAVFLLMTHERKRRWGIRQVHEVVREIGQRLGQSALRRFEFIVQLDNLTKAKLAVERRLSEPNPFRTTLDGLLRCCPGRKGEKSPRLSGLIRSFTNPVEEASRILEPKLFAHTERSWPERTAAELEAYHHKYGDLARPFSRSILEIHSSDLEAAVSFERGTPVGFLELKLICRLVENEINDLLAMASPASRARAVKALAEFETICRPALNDGPLSLDEVALIRRYLAFYLRAVFPEENAAVLDAIPLSELADWFRGPVLVHIGEAAKFAVLLHRRRPVPSTVPA